MKHKHKHLTPKQLAYLEKHYPDTPNEVLARRFGLSVHTIRSRAEKHKWHKSKAFVAKRRSEAAIRTRSADRINTAKAERKRQRTIRQRLEDDRERALAGLPQKTRKHFRTMSRQQFMQKCYLRRLGYVVNDAIRVAYYTPSTKRALRIEKVPRDTTRGQIHAYYDFWPLPEK